MIRVRFVHSNDSFLVEVHKKLATYVRRMSNSNLAPVVQKMDRHSAIHEITQLVSLTLIHWIMIYPMDSAIQRLNKVGLDIRIAGSFCGPQQDS